MDDRTLLHVFAENADQEAFAELVRRHAGLVYAVAWRRLGGDVQLAQDICQDVFVDMGRRAKALSKHPSLAAWLHRAARFAASHSAQARTRRSKREMTFAEEVPDARPDASLDWARLRPLLDEAVDRLKERDRGAVIMRYFENRSYVEIGRSLGLGEDAVRMRVDRSLEKLGDILRKRGVESTLSGLALAMTGEASAATPPGLIEAVARSALGALKVAGHATGGSAGLLGWVSGTKGPIALGAAVAALAVGGAVEWRHVQVQRATLSALDDRVARAEGDVRALLANPNRGKLPVSAAVGMTADHLTERVRRLRDWFARNPALAMPEFHLLNDADWVDFAYVHPKIDEGGDLWPVAALFRSKAMARGAAAIQSALKKFEEQSSGVPLTDPLQLLPYDASLDAAILSRYSAFPDISRVSPNYPTPFPEPALVSHPEVVDMPDSNGSGSEEWEVIQSFRTLTSSRRIGDTQPSWP